MANRTTLLKYVLSSIPFYAFSCINVPIIVTTRIEKEYRAFLWDHNSDQRSFHFVAWDNIYSHQQLKRLGIIPLHRRRQAFLLKLAANIIINPTSLWAKIITAKYHFLGTLINYDIPRNCSTIWRKFILAGLIV